MAPTKAPTSGCCSTKATKKEPSASADTTVVDPDKAPISSCCSTEAKKDGPSTCASTITVEPAKIPTSDCCPPTSPKNEPSACANSAITVGVTGPKSGCCSGTTKDKPNPCVKTINAAPPVTTPKSGCCSADAKKGTPSACAVTMEPVKAPKSGCCSAEAKNDVPGPCASSAKESKSGCCSVDAKKDVPGSCASPVKAPKSGCCSAEATTEKSCHVNAEGDIQVIICNKAGQDLKSACFEVNGMTCTGCENTLIAALRAHPSIANATANMFLNKAELSYDPATITTDDIVNIIKTAGFSARLQHSASGNQGRFIITRQANDIDPEKARNIIKSELDLKGIIAFDTAVNADGTSLDVTFDPDVTGTRDIAYALRSRGFNVELAKDDSEGDRKSGSEMIKMRRLLVLSVVFVIPVVFLAFIFPYAGTFEVARNLSARNLVLFLLATPIQLFVGAPIYRGAWNGIVLSHELNMDSLVILSTSCAYFYSTIATIVAMSSPRLQAPEIFFETSAILMTLIILGRYLQALARGRAADALSKLKNLQSSTANLVVTDNNGNETVEKIESGYLQRHDIIRVQPSEKIPADGVVLRGTADVDESNMTGESVPVAKGISDNVIGGSININGTLVIRVTRVQSEGKLSDIARLVEQAQASRTPSQAFADKIATWFTPFVIALGLITYLVWLILGLLGKVDTHEYPSGVLALTFAVAVLVVSCPCAIALAVPTVIVIGAGVGAKNGILVKDGSVFEEAADITHVVFDKTGTLTQAIFQVVECLELGNDNLQHAYDLAAASASNSEHPLSVAVAGYCRERSLQQLDGEDVTAHPGFGLACSIGGTEVRVGKMAWVFDENTELSSEASGFLVRSHQLGRSIVAVSSDRTPLLLFALADEPRAEATLVVDYIKKMRIQVHIISGDHQNAVNHMARLLDIEPSNAFGDCTPSDKLARLAQLQDAGCRVAFCGDGTNDAPVLAQAQVGVAMGAGTSSNVAIATAKVVLLTSDLRGMAITLDLARRVMARIRINFAWAFVYNLLAIPIAAGCLVPVMDNARIPPELAGLGELVSVMPVLFFAMLLKRYHIPDSLMKPGVHHGSQV
ncbi:hypothetical protein BGX34_011737 [Mortierella sp. NVP85]|nr:hypothetical protein BGX34_011737 [Mortierella sp. NVP85]